MFRDPAHDGAIGLCEGGVCSAVQYRYGFCCGNDAIGFAFFLNNDAKLYIRAFRVECFVMVDSERDRIFRLDLLSRDTLKQLAVILSVFFRRHFVPLG